MHVQTFHSKHGARSRTGVVIAEMPDGPYDTWLLLCPAPPIESHEPGEVHRVTSSPAIWGPSTGETVYGKTSDLVYAEAVSGADLGTTPIPDEVTGPVWLLASEWEIER